MRLIAPKKIAVNSIDHAKRKRETSIVNGERIKVTKLKKKKKKLHQEQKEKMIHI